MNGTVLALFLALSTGQAVPPAEAPAPAPQESCGKRTLNFLKDFTVDTGHVMLRPFWPHLTDLWILAPAAVATTFAITHDVPIYADIHDRWPNPVILNNHLSTYVTFLGEGYVDAGVFTLIGLIGGKKEKRVWLEGLEALAATAITAQALKVVFGVVRPAKDPGAKHYFTAHGWNQGSMPSGHTMAAFATATVLALEYPRAAIPLYLLAIAVGISRIQEGAHWMSDVIVGAALGTLHGMEAVNLHMPVKLPVTAIPMRVGDGTGFGLVARF